MYLFSPCLIFTQLAQSTLSPETFGLIVAFSLVTTLLMAVLSWGVSKTARFNRSMESAFLLSILFINAGNYGLSVNLFAFGEEGLTRALPFFITNAFLTNSLGVYLASRGKAEMRQALANVFKMPLIYATIAGLAFNAASLSLPAPIMQPLEMAGKAAIPLMLVLLGMELSHASLGNDLGAIGLATFMRLVVAAGVALVMAALFRLEGVTRNACILEASMPTAVSSTILAVEFDSRPEFVTGTALISTLASIVTLTLLLRFLMG